MELEKNCKNINKKSKLLDEHIESCSKRGKFVEAELIKQKITHLKNVEENKITKEIKTSYDRERENMEFEQKIELDRLNYEYDNKLLEYQNKLKELEENIKKEYDKKIENAKENYSLTIKEKPSKQLIEVNNALKNSLKTKK